MRWMLLALILLLLAACTEKTIVNTQSETGLEQPKTTPTTKSKTIEIRLTANDIFEPNTIEVEEGTNVRLQFMNADPHTFSLSGYRITEKVSNNHLDFVANKKGTFSFECMDCKYKNPGLLKVL
ncbi:MAG: cupredoxin domain-containing protein [Nanoarchaeota archaeon]|nr:cupredoxin domain-containing protein [Nanoarchaeota archaeon]MBU1269847.1 cupredoxin domain-containing protein [Nanoarchaeota archaeon]MBU1605156.1 cupredoxin domain-containing protein [Nanoarchaeota archaeon]MBU2442970.1 cupredoxin domain-containing protein [Nanoarchaeota archaeon]